MEAAPLSSTVYEGNEKGRKGSMCDDRKVIIIIFFKHFTSLVNEHLISFIFSLFLSATMYRGLCVITVSADHEFKVIADFQMHFQVTAWETDLGICYPRTTSLSSLLSVRML